ncbi:hypothetical protein SESBI_09671 [Sesbania bispinosa]|nr:hypothetical protein SESBI_09671 [Sesbania bispinosa]
MMNHDREFSNTLGDSLYVISREALYRTSRSNAMDGEQLNQVATILPTEELIRNKQDGAKDIFCEDRSNQYAAHNYNGEILDASIEDIVGANNEKIVQIEEDVNKVHDIPIEEADNEEIVEANSEEIVQIEEDVNKVHDIPNEEADNEEIVYENSEEIVQIEEDVNKVHGIPIEEADNEEIVYANKEEIVQIEEDVNKVHGIPIEETDNEENVYANSEEIVQIGEDVNKVHGFPIEKADNEEIVEVEEVDKKAHDIPNEEENVLKGKKNVYVSLDVKHALETRKGYFNGSGI